MPNSSTYGLASRALPQATIDKQEIEVRYSRYGEPVAKVLTPTKHELADEGSYFVTTSGTPGTGIQLAANVTAFADTNGLFVIGNTDSPTNPAAKRVYLDQIRLLLLATAPTATVSMEFAIKRSLISREPTTAANKTVLTPANMAGSASRPPVARLLSYANAGAMTVPASSPLDPVLFRGRIPTGLGIAGDEYVLKFGGEDLGPSRGGAAVRATDPGRIITTAPPIIIEPGEWHVIHMWWLSSATTAASFEFELAHWER